jgi:hypothetical protein
VLRSEHRADRLRLRADQLGRRSARQLGVVVSLARMAELRTIVASSELSNTIRKVGKVGRSADAYEIDFDIGMLVAVYDRRGQSIAMFLLPDAAEITQTLPSDVGRSEH